MEQPLPEFAKRRVRDIMTSEVITIEANATIREIALLIAKHDITGLPVVDQTEKVVGVVTELDMMVRNTRFKMPNYIMILDMMVYLEYPTSYQDRVNNVLGATASQIMSSPAITINPSASIEELAELMVEKRMNPVPVVEDDKLVGVVSRKDIIHLMAREFKQTDDE